ncbi:MAG: hypothetical protein ACP6IY_22265 [Promethearchaeia archaeon]
MENKEIIYICALRYALGRTSYITELVANFLLEKKLSKECEKAIIKEIENFKYKGHKIDQKNWEKLLKHLK